MREKKEKKEKKAKKAAIKYDSLTVEGVKYKTLLTKKYKDRKPYQEIDFRVIKAFISGGICDIFVKVGSTVKAGDSLLILEAMKMKNIILAPQDGIIKSINVKTGAKVIKGDLLVEME